MKPIAMLCNAEQYKSIEQILINNNFKIQQIFQNVDENYLVNNLSGSYGIISTTYDDYKNRYDREVHEVWNADIFLQYCDIETEFVLPKKWCVKASSCKTVQKFFLSYKNNTIKDFVTHDAYFNRYFHSATVGNDWKYAYTEIQSGFTEITLEQFKKYVMESDKFILPKKWYCIVTEENKKMLSEWRLTVAESHLNVSMPVSYLVLSKHAFDKSNYHSCFKEFKQDNAYIDYVEITTEQFKKYVMKEKEINQLPERFAILYCATNPLWKVYTTWLNKTYNNNYVGNAEHCYYGYNGNDSFCRRDVNSTKELTILTLEQWDNIINKNQIKQKMNKQKLIVPASDITKLYNVACNTWMVIIAGYLGRVGNDKNIIFTSEEIGRMFNEATSAQLPLLEEIFGKQAEIIDFSRLNVGSVVMLEYSNKTFMINSIVDFDKPFTIIMHDTKGRINIDGKYIENVDTDNTYITFVQNTDDKGYFVSCVNKDIDFITEVISY